MGLSRKRKEKVENEAMMKEREGKAEKLKEEDQTR